MRVVTKRDHDGISHNGVPYPRWAVSINDGPELSVVEYLNESDALAHAEVIRKALAWRPTARVEGPVCKGCLLPQGTIDQSGFCITCRVLHKNPVCRGCGTLLWPENFRIADGCPCNSPRGVNHGVVPKDTCTCVECDPEQTGSTRYPESDVVAESVMGMPFAAGAGVIDGGDGAKR